MKSLTKKLSQIEVTDRDQKVIWCDLANITISRLSIFNKRRGNEVSKRYLERKNYAKALHDDVTKSLSPLEKKLMERALNIRNSFTLIENNNIIYIKIPNTAF